MHDRGSHAQADEDMTKSTRMDAAYSGTTACMAVVHDGHVYTANVGDSGACLGRQGAHGRIQAVELTKYARPNDPQVAKASETAPCCYLTPHIACPDLCEPPHNPPHAPGAQVQCDSFC